MRFQALAQVARDFYGSTRVGLATLFCSGQEGDQGDKLSEGININPTSLGSSAACLGLLDIHELTPEPLSLNPEPQSNL